MCFVFFGFTGRIPDNSIKWLFDQQSSPVLTSWSQFDSVISHFASDSTENTVSVKKEQFQLLVDSLQDLCCDIIDQDVDEDKNLALKEKINFQVEQMKLNFSTVNKYSCDTLLWAFRIFSAAPQTYLMMRNTVLTLPHPSYLKRLSSSFQINSGFQDGAIHQTYLQKKCQNLSEMERYVILMVDEIHVAHQMSYKAGKLEGSASNGSVAEASTAQVFMISSLVSKQKDVVAIVPVKFANATWLHEISTNVLSVLHNSGYTVVCVISDNNRINRNAFTVMCGGELKSYIENPFRRNEKLFFLFDTVHLFKCIRNNWLAQNDVEKTFTFPAVHGQGAPMKASFSHLQRLFREEKSSTVKLAPSLTQKCLNPTATEKQNVKLMLKIFDQRNIAALEHFEDVWQVDTSGTRQFLMTIIRLWNITNVKQPYKDIRLRNGDCRAITSSSDENVRFINQIVLWLTEWKGLRLKPREGTLSAETMTALTHTLSAFVQLCKYLLEEKNFHYVLLGKFQTDNLEFRFSQYRQMSGSNYHVSVQQLLEGEKKLKLLSVLNMISASNGALSLRDIIEPLEEVRSQQTSQADGEYETFLPVLSDCEEINVTSEQLKALVFVSGYCVAKALRHIDCVCCRNDIHCKRQLRVEVTRDCHTYLSALDRGGLTWPTDFAVSTITEVFRVFQALIDTVEKEQQFLACRNQRKLVINLSLQRLTDLGMTQKRCEECGIQYGDIFLKCCRPAVNIFLNNYSKAFTDRATAGNKSRKLQTFTKRT